MSAVYEPGVTNRPLRRHIPHKPVGELDGTPKGQAVANDKSHHAALAAHDVELSADGISKAIKSSNGSKTSVDAGINLMQSYQGDIKQLEVKSVQHDQLASENMKLGEHALLAGDKTAAKRDFQAARQDYQVARSERKAAGKILVSEAKVAGAIRQAQGAHGVDSSLKLSGPGNSVGPFDGGKGGASNLQNMATTDTNVLNAAGKDTSQFKGKVGDRHMRDRFLNGVSGVSNFVDTNSAAYLNDASANLVGYAKSVAAGDTSSQTDQYGNAALQDYVASSMEQTTNDALLQDQYQVATGTTPAPHP